MQAGADPAALGWAAPAAAPGNEAQLRENLGEIRRRLDEHARLLGLEGPGRACGGDCGCGHKALLKRLLAESVFELERTRSSFKSRQIEQLRKKFMVLLAQLD